jgi:hypothetical protein
MKNAQYNSNEIKKICENKLSINFRSGKEFNGWFKFNGKRIARITVPKGKKEVPRGTYKSMANQLKLKVNQFDDFLECDINYNEYIEIINPFL